MPEETSIWEKMHSGRGKGNDAEILFASSFILRNCRLV